MPRADDRRVPGPLVSAWALLAVAAGACGGPARASGDLGNRAAAVAAIDVPPDQPLGLLALASRDAEPFDGRYWIPVGPGLGVVVPALPDVDPLPAGEQRLVVVAPGGEQATLTVGGRVRVPYGCDGSGSFDALSLGGALPAGLAWVLPASVPSAWRPGAVALTAQTARAEASWTAGPLTVTLSVTGARTADLAIARDGRELSRRPAEAYLMDGADDGPIDLVEPRQPGLPVPAAVFALAPGGPHLLVLDVSGYEGVGFETVLVTETEARPVETMALQQYYCAF